MINSGILLGFKPSESQDFILNTLEATIELLRLIDKHPGPLKWEIASPGGTTIGAIKSNGRLRCSRRPYGGFLYGL